MSARTRTLTTPAVGEGLEVALTATAAEVIVEAVEGLEEARAEVAGPPEVLGAVTADRSGAAWHLTVPALTRAAGHIIQAGDIGSIIVGGDVHVAGIHTGQGGVTVLSGVRGGGAAEVSVRLRVPAGTRLRTRLASGSVVTSGPLSAVDHDGDAARVEVGAAGEVVAATRSGAVRVAGTTGRIRVTTAVGNIDVAAAPGADVEAHSQVGDVRVRTA
ncbi:DUF4097 family beta strand repeat-containing protein [Streptomonospora nanhaiensis]|uniref:hypothetical protein n=1 Tax=Streptomonospora nanhaiensis TaxID=1323731 RepID=UPI001C3889E6|nr:hypothetical protein [Streptomonospora nanhaiensis]MBV2367116.1 hypothetical protein [Streptomonospora nanhaiensis]